MALSVGGIHRHRLPRVFLGHRTRQSCCYSSRVCGAPAGLKCLAHTMCCGGDNPMVVSQEKVPFGPWFYTRGWIEGCVLGLLRWSRATPPQRKCGVEHPPLLWGWDPPGGFPLKRRVFPWGVFQKGGTFLRLKKNGRTLKGAFKALLRGNPREDVLKTQGFKFPPRERGSLWNFQTEPRVEKTPLLKLPCKIPKG